MWKKISEKTLLTHPRLTVIEDQIELPNGHITDYIYFKHDSNAATIVCENEKGEIRVQEEFNYPLGKSLIELPGGAIPLNEDIDQGAQRELMEEAGLRALNLTKIGEYYCNNRRTQAKMFVYYASEFVEEKMQHDIEEDIHSYWMHKDILEEKIRNGEIQNMHLLACWALYKAM